MVTESGSVVASVKVMEVGREGGNLAWSINTDSSSWIPWTSSLCHLLHLWPKNTSQLGWLLPSDLEIRLKPITAWLFTLTAGQETITVSECGHQQTSQHPCHPSTPVTPESAPTPPPDPSGTKWPCQTPASQPCTEAGPGKEPALI